jgi:hypothetical protein
MSEQPAALLMAESAEQGAGMRERREHQKTRRIPDLRSFRGSEHKQDYLIQRQPKCFSTKVYLGNLREREDRQPVWFRVRSGGAEH